MAEVKRPELLAPAGDLEKLKIAVEYGADAVYFGGELFSLRAGAGNLSVEEIREGTAYAHDRGRKVYMTINIFAHNEDMDRLQDYLKQIAGIPIDGFIVSPNVTVSSVETLDYEFRNSDHNPVYITVNLE